MSEELRMKNEECFALFLKKVQGGSKFLDALAQRRAFNARNFILHSSFFIFILLAACSPSRPRGILSEEKMADVLVDYHLAQGMAEAQGTEQDVTRYKYIQAVFRKHRITEAEFDSSMVYWSGRADEFTHIYDNVVNRVQAQAERLGLEASASAGGDQFSSLTSEGDTANIWLGKDFACIVANPVGCVWSFHMKADSTFRPGDSFIWRFKSQFVSKSMNNEAIALLNFYYENDTVDYATDLLRNSPKNELRHDPGKGLDSLNLLSISGYIYLPLAKSDPPKPLLISDMMLIRMHKKVESLDSRVESDSLAADTLAVDTLLQQSERLSPLQVRENQPKERKIHVTKENPNPIRPERGIPQRTNRRR